MASACTPPLCEFFTFILLFINLCFSKTLYKCKWIPHLHFLHLVDKWQELCLWVSSSDSQSRAALERKFFEKHICDTHSENNIFFFFLQPYSDWRRNIDCSPKGPSEPNCSRALLHCSWQASFCFFELFPLLSISGSSETISNWPQRLITPSAESVRMAQMKWNYLPPADNIERTPSPTHGYNILLEPLCVCLWGEIPFHTFGSEKIRDLMKLEISN